MDSSKEKVRENYLRRQADRLGWALRKSRAKKWSIDNQGGYMIIDPFTNSVVFGEKYDLDLKDVEKILNEQEEKLRNQN
ncbi:MAG: hypothetical protein ACOYJ1_05760 [Peptococcales bacterium]